MAKKIYIGGRFESVEQGNVVAGANAILDDTKGKKQNVINAETDAELLRLQNEKQNNLTFDNVPTENSNNPVKSGGVYTANLALQEAIEAIMLLIPSAASALNKLVDEAQMNDKISTASATFRGTYTSVQALDNVQGDANDYAYVSTTDAAGNSTYDKYKYVEGTGWVFEYKLNNNAFTATEWAAIQSGITAALVGKLSDLPTAEQLITTFAGKQDVLTFDDAPTLGSNNPVKSSGIKTELNTKQPTLVVGTNLDASPTEYSTNPVTSGGVWAAINAIAVKISAEASSSNQLADKAWVVSSIAAAILAAIPSFKGQFTSLADLLLVENPKAGDLGIVLTTGSDGYAVFTMYQFLNDTWNVFYTLSHHNLKKPATTGITGEYPYNGMGKVVLDKNIVGGVNTLTQDMFYKGEVGSRVPNTNTVFVIQYDFVLEEDITIPANCVLKFEGGSISGETIDLNDCDIVAPLKPVFVGTALSAVYTKEVHAEWFNILPDTTASSTVMANLVRYCHIIRFGEGQFNFTSTITFGSEDAILAVIGAEHGRHRFPKTIFYFTDCNGFTINSGAKRIENIEITGNNPGTWNNTTHKYDDVMSAIKAHESFYLYRCSVVDCGYGIDLSDTNADIVSMFVRFCEFRRCKNDAIIISPRTLNQCIIEGCYFASCGKDGGLNSLDSTERYSGHGINICKGNAVSIINNVFEYNAGCGIIVRSINSNAAPLAATIVGNDFEHNKYTQIFITYNSQYDKNKIFVKSNFYTDADTVATPLPANALPQRTACIEKDEHRPEYLNNVVLEDFSDDYYVMVPDSEKKEFVFNHVPSSLWGNDNGEIVGLSSGASYNKLLGMWRILKSGYYRIALTVKLNASGSLQMNNLAMQIGSTRTTIRNVTISSTEYVTVYTFFAYLNERDIVRLNNSAGISSISPSGNIILIKDIKLEEAKDHGTTAERPDFENLSGVGIGFTYYNETDNKLQVFTASGWADV